MATRSERRLEAVFPELVPGSYEITSPADPAYNCVAWAAGDHQRGWEPDPMGVCYWPVSAPRTDTLAAYVRAFEGLGYTECPGQAHEEGVDRVALFAKGGQPTHVARQVGPLFWSSKLGKSVDLRHQLHALSGDAYRAVVRILHRR